MAFPRFIKVKDHKNVTSLHPSVAEDFKVLYYQKLHDFIFALIDAQDELPDELYLLKGLKNLRHSKDHPRIESALAMVYFQLNKYFCTEHNLELLDVSNWLECYFNLTLEETEITDGLVPDAELDTGKEYQSEIEDIPERLFYVCDTNEDPSLRSHLNDLKKMLGAPRQALDTYLEGRVKEFRDYLIPMISAYHDAGITTKLRADIRELVDLFGLDFCKLQIANYVVEKEIRDFYYDWEKVVRENEKSKEPNLDGLFIEQEKAPTFADLITEIRGYHTSSWIFTGYNSVTIKELAKLANEKCKVIFTTIPDGKQELTNHQLLNIVQEIVGQKESHKDYPVVFKYKNKIYVCGANKKMTICQMPKNCKVQFPPEMRYQYQNILNLPEQFFKTINDAAYGGSLSQQVKIDEVRNAIKKEKWTQRDRRLQLFSYTQANEDGGVKNPKKSYATDTVIENLRKKFNGF